MNNQLPSNPALPTGETNPSQATAPPAPAGQPGGPQGQGGMPNTKTTPGAPYDQVGGSGGVVGPNNQPPPPQPAPAPGQGGGPGNFGQAMYPWLLPYGGQFTAPMSPTEQNALGGYSDFVMGGQGLNGARDYLGNVLNNNYLDLGRNPYLQQIQSGMQGMKDYQDAQAMKRIQSSGAAGGSALSGAMLGAQSDYLRNSNNSFQQLMGQLMNENYGRERGIQSMAPGQLGDIARQYGSGFGEMSQMGALPRQLQQQDLGAQYGDWLRQTQGMQQAFQYPDTLTQQLLYGGGFRGQTPNQYGSSQGDVLSGLLGQSGIDWGSLLSGAGNAIGGLFSGGGGGGGSTDTSMYDGTPLGYDGPSGYGDAGYYNTALTAAQNKAAADAAAAKNGPNTMPAALIAMLIQLLGGGQKKGSNSSFKPSAGAGPSSGGQPQKPKQGPPPPGMSGPNEQTGPAMAAGNEINLGNMTATSPYGYDFPIGPGTDFTENTSFYQTDPSLPNIPFENLGQEGPYNIFSGQDSPFNIFADQGSQGNGPEPNIPGGFGGDLNVNEQPMDWGATGFDDWGGGGGSDFGGGDEMF